MTRAADLAKLIAGGGTITVADNSDTLTLEGTDADANVGPILNLHRNSSSPADDDALGRISFDGKDDAGNNTTYARIDTQIVDASNGSEDSALLIHSLTGGSERERVRITQTETVFNEGSTDLDFRVESDGNTHALFLEGSSGNVGLGTTSPSAILDVTSTDSDAVFLRSSQSTTTNVYITNTNATADNTANLFFAPANNVAGSKISSIAIEDFSSSANRTAELAFSTRKDGTMSEAMRIDSDGDVGIGTTSPVSNSNYATLTISDTTGGQTHFKSTGGSVTAYVGADSTSSGVGYLATETNHPLLLRTNNTERMRINSSGAVMIGTTSSPNDAPLLIHCGTNDNIRFNQETHATISGVNDAANAFVSLKLEGNDLILNSQSTSNILLHATSDGGVGNTFKSTGQQRMAMSGTSALQLVQFANGNGQIGTITLSGSSTSFNTSSDYRLKENVVTEWDATSRLKQLKPSRFNFKADKDTTLDGFLAHEVSSIVPEAIHGEKDAVDKDGNPEYQNIDQSKLVPLMVKTIQELEARIATLESK